MSTAERIPRSDLEANRGRGFILLAGLLWSLAGVFIKFLWLPPLTIVFYRSLFASAFFLIFVLLKKSAASRFTFPLFISVSSYTAAISAFVWANKLTTAANAIVLQYTAPIFVFVFVRLFFREAISKLNRITLLLGMLGVGVIFVGSAGQPDARGVTVAVLSGFLFSIYMVNLRFLKEVHPAYLTFVNNLVCCVILIPFVKSQLALSSGETLALAVMGVVQLGIPYFLFSKGLETVSLPEASLIVLIEPVLNPIWVALIVGEVPSIATLLGGSLILFGLGFRHVVLLLSRAREAQISPPA